MRFVTGSCVCATRQIKITFNSLSGLARRPISHTCDNLLDISTTYFNYNDFQHEFSVYLDKVNEEFILTMDGV